MRELLFFLSEPIPLSLPHKELTDYIEDNDQAFRQVSDETNGTNRGGFRDDRKIFQTASVEILQRAGRFST